jgi:hypothetical protein
MSEFRLLRILENSTLTFTGRDCPEGPKDTKTCYRCGTAGHISRDCPQSAPAGGAGGGASGAECYKVRLLLEPGITTICPCC